MHSSWAWPATSPGRLCGADLRIEVARTYAELLAGQQELCARLGYPDAWRDHWQGGQPVDTDQGSVEVAGLLVR